jgi:hypothetical protein
MALITKADFPENARVEKGEFRAFVDAVAGRIQPMLDALDPTGDQTAGKGGRPVVVVPGQGQGPLSTGDMDLAGIGGIVGDRITGVTVSASAAITDDAHGGRVIFCTNAGDITLTATKGTNQGLHIGDRFSALIYRMGDGAVTIAVGGGLTLRHASGHTRLGVKYGSARLIRWVDDLILEGSTSA